MRDCDNKFLLVFVLTIKKAESNFHGQFSKQHIVITYFCIILTKGTSRIEITKSHMDLNIIYCISSLWTNTSELILSRSTINYWKQFLGLWLFAGNINAGIILWTIMSTHVPSLCSRSKSTCKAHQWKNWRLQLVYCRVLPSALKEIKRWYQLKKIM